jgi:L-aspartate oxidase
LNNPEYEPENLEPISVDPNNEASFLTVQNEIAQLMSENLGIVRSEDGIKKALKQLEEIENKYSNHRNEYNLLKIRNTVSVCLLIAEAALHRQESRGGHIREDYKNENPDFKVHSIQQKGKEIYFEQVKK